MKQKIVPITEQTSFFKQIINLSIDVLIFYFLQNIGIHIAKLLGLCGHMFLHWLRQQCGWVRWDYLQVSFKVFFCFQASISLWKQAEFQYLHTDEITYSYHEYSVIISFYTIIYIWIFISKIPSLSKTNTSTNAYTYFVL